MSSNPPVVLRAERCAMCSGSAAITRDGMTLCGSCFLDSCARREGLDPSESIMEIDPNDLANVRCIDCSQAAVITIRHNARTLCRDCFLNSCAVCLDRGSIVTRQYVYCGSCLFRSCIEWLTGDAGLYESIRDLPQRAAEHVVSALIRRKRDAA